MAVVNVVGMKLYDHNDGLLYVSGDKPRITAEKYRPFTLLFCFGFSRAMGCCTVK